MYYDQNIVILDRSIKELQKNIAIMQSSINSINKVLSTQINIPEPPEDSVVYGRQRLTGETVGVWRNLNDIYVSEAPTGNNVIYARNNGNWVPINTFYSTVNYVLGNTGNFIPLYQIYSDCINKMKNDSLYVQGKPSIQLDIIYNSPATGCYIAQSNVPSETTKYNVTLGDLSVTQKTVSSGLSGVGQACDVITFKFYADNLVDIILLPQIGGDSYIYRMDSVVGIPIQDNGNSCLDIGLVKGEQDSAQFTVLASYY